MSVPNLAPTATGLVFGRVPPPARLRDDYIDKPAGWSALGPRTIRGVCLHRTLGGPIVTTGDYFRTFDARFDDGGHGWNALTDWGVGLDGTVLRWNGDKERSPHANGPITNPDGDAVAFLARYGAAAVNRDLESIELEGLTYDSPVTSALMEAAVELIAWRIDRAMIPWHIWPQNRDGLQAIYWHGEFGPKECPGPVVRARTDELIDRVQARLRTYQLQTRPGALPPDPARTGRSPRPGLVRHGGFRRTSLHLRPRRPGQPPLARPRPGDRLLAHIRRRRDTRRPPLFPVRQRPHGLGRPGRDAADPARPTGHHHHT